MIMSSSHNKRLIYATEDISVIYFSLGDNAGFVALQSFFSVDKNVQFCCFIQYSQKECLFCFADILA